ncbi:MAG: hypothetical protein EU529_05900 [Promethearchaeota archaeon]|nr:MAG: hypothetical protein EU529_05900 [Candidatus Lokiarchaeota archaeon]
MTEQWEIDQYEKEVGKIRPQCKKGEVLSFVGSPFTTTNLSLSYLNGAIMYVPGIVMNVVGANISCSVYIDKQWDDNFDIKMIIPFMRIDANGGVVNMKLNVGACKTDGSEQGTMENVENNVDIEFPACGELGGQKYLYILRKENFEIGDIVAMQIKLNHAGRSVEVYTIQVVFKKRRD